MTSIVGVLALHAQYLSTTSRSRGQDVNLNGVKRSRSRLRCGQAVKQAKRWSKFFDPGRSCDYGVNRSDHPLLVRCDIDAEGISHLAQALCVNATLRVVELSRNTIDSKGAEHLGKLSGGVWGYGLTCNIRQCQCATSNREMSVVKIFLPPLANTKP